MSRNIPLATPPADTGQPGTPGTPEKAANGWVDASSLAAVLSVSRDFVYSNAGRLGAVRLGTGPRARLRFNVPMVLERLGSCPEGRRSDEPEPRTVTRQRRPAGSHRSGSGVELLPIRRPLVDRGEAA